MRERIDQGLNLMVCTRLIMLGESTLIYRFPYENARHLAAEAVWEAITLLQLLATPEEVPLLDKLGRAYKRFQHLNSETASLALLAKTPEDLQNARDFYINQEQTSLKQVMSIWQPYRNNLIPEHIDDGWETASLSSVGIDTAVVEAMTERIRAFSNLYQHIDSVVIVRYGKLAYEQYFNGFQRGEAHRLYDATVSIASLLTGVAIDHGFLTNEHVPVHTFVANDARKAKRTQRLSSLTVQHLLTMTTPGKPFEYAPHRLRVLSHVLTRASGMSVSDLASRYLYKPMGITTSRWQQPDGGLIPLSSGHWLRPRDMAKLGELVLRRGVWKGKRLLSETWITTSTQPHISIHHSDTFGYGYLWLLENSKVNANDITTIWAQGYGGQCIFIIPAFDLVVVFTGSQYSQNGYLSTQANQLLKHIILNAVQ